MKISYNWLRNYIDLDLPATEVAEMLTNIGLEVDEFTSYNTLPEGIEQFVIGHVKEVIQHPNADRLRLTKVDIGTGELLSIVCGAPNVAEGQKVPVATIGTEIRPFKGEPFTIKKSKIRGEVSEGMLCAEDELGLGGGHEGLMVLPQDAPVGRPLSSVLKGYSDNIIDIGLTPNRVDAACHIGVARDLSALLSKPLIYPDNDLHIREEDKPTVRISIDDKEGCPRYSGLVIRGVKVSESPDWLKNYLQAVGLSPINNIVDITNFVMLEYGQPLHAFDLNNIEGQHIIIRKAHKGEKITTLDKLERTLEGTELVIADTKKPIALAGVFGGLHSGINETTTDIFIESAHFDPSITRRSARRHQLHTDASFRFERGSDPLITFTAARRAAQLILNEAGGQIENHIYDECPEPIKHRELFVSFDRLNSLVGMEIPAETVSRILHAMEFEVVGRSDDGLGLKVPTFKPDVHRPIDVIEEVLRIYSINKIPVPTTIKSILQVDHLRNREMLRSRISAFLVDNGFHEAYLLNFLRAEDNLQAEKTPVRVVNPLSSDLEYLRNEAMVSGLKSVQFNLNRQQEKVSLFEWGSTHYMEDGAFRERKHLALWMSGLRNEANWHEKGRIVDFFYLKGIVEAILKVSGLEAATAHKMEDSAFEYALEYKLDARPLLSIGKLSTDVLSHAGIDEDVFYAEFNAGLILGPKSKPLSYQPVSRFPKMERDLALQVPKQVSYADLQALIQRMNNRLVRKLSIFDVYEGEQVKPGFKSYAIRLSFEDPSQTLEDKVVDKIMQQIIRRLQEELNIEIR